MKSEDISFYFVGKILDGEMDTTCNYNVLCLLIRS